MASRFHILGPSAKSILSPTSGFIAEAGFTHSLRPARNRPYACTDLFVPSMDRHGGPRMADWQRWGQFTAFTDNAAGIAVLSLLPQIRAAGSTRRQIPGIFAKPGEHPPTVVTIQTGSKGILHDLGLLVTLDRRTGLSVNFSLNTRIDGVRRLHDLHCAPFSGGLMDAALAVITLPVPGDPLHLRATKSLGATTRPAAWRIAANHGHVRWFDPPYQQKITERIRQRAGAANRPFAVGPEAFRWLAQPILQAHNPTPGPIPPRFSHVSELTV
ncbi:MAG: hypothetical protein JNL98_15310 [Bryobacterales bacterium]|nr:hypothetical protein [Bryobacterales bacterium]